MYLEKEVKPKSSTLKYIERGKTDILRTQIIENGKTDIISTHIHRKRSNRYPKPTNT
jgi:hypothetical protein